MVKFTQYLLPNGHPQSVAIDLDGQTETKAQEIIDAGLVFECELLSGFRLVSFTIGDKTEEEDVAIKICPNGVEVPNTVTNLIMEFDLEAWKAGTLPSLIAGDYEGEDDGKEEA